MTTKKRFPGPSSPWWWQTYQYMKNTYEFLSLCKKKYGEPFSISVTSKREFVFFSHPDAIRDIFTAHYNNVFSAPINAPLVPIVGDESLFALDSDRHVKMRRLITPPFLGKAMRSYGEVIHNVAKKNTAKWEKNTQIVIHNVMTTISLEIILCAVFGLKEGARFEQYKKALVDYLSIFGGFNATFLYVKALQKNLGPLTIWSKYLKMTKIVDQLVYEEIARRRSNTEQNDIFSCLLAIRDEEGNGLSDKELRDQLITLLAAGHETTATSLTWCFSWIHSNSQILEKLCQELSPFRNNFDISEIVKLKYLDAVCHEALRLYPVISNVGRIVQHPMSVMGHEFQPKTPVIVSIYLTHHREDLYPDPHIFRPERFIERKFNSYEYIPFGGGARRCLGMHFAFYEMKIILAHVLLKFQLLLANNKPAKAVRRGVTFTPDSGIPMLVNKIMT